MSRSILLRIILDIVLFFSIIHGCWFIALPVVLVGAWRLFFVVEIITAGVMYDALFGMVHGSGIWGYVGTITALILLAVFRLLKSVVR